MQTDKHSLLLPNIARNLDALKHYRQHLMFTFLLQRDLRSSKIDSFYNGRLTISDPAAVLTCINTFSQIKLPPHPEEHRIMGATPSTGQKVQQCT